MGDGDGIVKGHATRHNSNTATPLREKVPMDEVHQPSHRPRFNVYATLNAAMYRPFTARLGTANQGCASASMQSAKAGARGSQQWTAIAAACLFPRPVHRHRSQSCCVESEVASQIWLDV